MLVLGDFGLCLCLFWVGGFFFFPCCGLVVAAVVVAVADGRDGCGWCFGCFFGKCDILFYCSGYIILL